MRRLLLMLLLMAACHRRGEFGGALLVRPGEQADVTNCSVAMLVLRDSLYEKVAEVASGPLDEFGRSPFLFRDVLPGDYYFFAWKDIDGDTLVSDDDLVGVWNGEFRRGYFGPAALLRGAWRYELGDIEVRRLAELEFTVSGRRVEQDTVTEFTYVLSHDARLTGLLITFPLYGTYPDASGPGLKLGDSTYCSSGWHLSAGAMPAGEHRLRFRGAFQDSLFDTTITVTVE